MSGSYVEVEERLRSYPRVDGLKKVTGLAKYAADWDFEDLLYGRVIKSSIPHGLVKGVDTSEALKVRGVRAIVTCLDDQTIWNAGERFHRRRVFTDHVRFLGDIIGAVAAESRFDAIKAAGLVKVEYQEYPGVFNVEDAMKPNAPQIWEDGNVRGPLITNYGDIEGDFARADLIVEAHYRTSRVANAQMEPAASLAWWDGDRLTVIAATQSIFGCREGIARDLGLPLEKVRVITQYKGGGFGNKASSMNYDLIAAILAKRTGRPVLVELSREEEFSLVHGRWSTDQHLKAAVTREGRVLGVKLKAYCDVGAYTRHVGKFVEGPEVYYSTTSWSSEVYVVYTNTPPTGHMRAPTGPQSCFAAESLMDEIAHKLRINPVDFRLRNAVIRAHNTLRLTSNGLRDCLQVGAEEFNWYERWREPPEDPSKLNDTVKGVGVAIGAWHSRVGRGEARLSLGQDGSLKLYVGVVDIGTGAKTTMALIASRHLGIPLERIEVTWGDTDLVPYSIGESGSRTTSFTGNAVKEAALKLKRQILVAASRLTGMDEDRLEIRGGRVVSRDGRVSLDLGEVVRKAGAEEFQAFASTEQGLGEDEERLSFAAHFCEVEVDSETGEVKVKDYLAVHESGEIVNLLTAESQVKGGVTMGIGMSLTEGLIISPQDGSPLNGNFMTYRIPNATQVPRIRVKFVEVEDPYGPKSLGEVPIVPVPACIGNAIFNATGVRLRDLPFSREALLRGMGRL